MTGTMLSDGVSFLNDALSDACGITITYQRGVATASLTAVVGQTLFETDNQFGVLRIESRDYLVAVTDFATFGEPQRGDRIIETQGANSVAHEVLDVSGIPPFAYSDQSRKRLRIHTKRITTT